MTAAPGLTLQDAQRMIDNAIRDRTYQQTRLGSAVREYLAWLAMGRSARTLEIYELYLATLCIHVAADDPAVDEIDEAMLLGCLTTIPAGSRRLARTAWSGFFRWASSPRRRLCPYNPVQELPALRRPVAKVYDIFSPTEQGRIALATDRMPLPWVQRLRARCVIDLGARSAELRGLQPQHFDLNERVVVVYGKGSKERLVPFGDDLFKAFIGFRNRPIPAVEHHDAGGRWLEPRKPRDDDYLFFPYGVTAGVVGWTRPAKQLSDRAIRYWWERLTDTAGVRYRSLHMARHSLGTDLSTAGEDLGTIQDWLGHADPKTTKIYVHNSRSRLQQGRKALDQYRQRHTG